MAPQEVDWSNLPVELLNLVLSKIPNVIHRIWFGTVCRSWHLAAKIYTGELSLRNGHRMLPMLMIPAEDNPAARRLYSVTDNKVHDILLPVGFENTSCGSSYGWLAFPKVENNDMVITLVNPFKGIAIPLPPLEDNPEFLTKVVLSADPASSPNKCVVAAIYGPINRLAFLKSGSKSWTRLDDGLDDELTIFFDVVFYKNLVYAVTQPKIIVSFDVNSCSDDGRPVINKLTPSSSAVDMSYLVESSKGDLLFVERIMMDDEDEGMITNIAENFKVHKVRLDGQTGAVIDEAEVKTLEGDALFLGYNSSIAIPAQNFPGCEPNSIYFTDNYDDLGLHEKFGPRDLGIFSLEDGSCSQHYEFKQSEKFLAAALWILPPY